MKPVFAVHNCPFCDPYLEVSDDDYKPLPGLTVGQTFAEIDRIEKEIAANKRELLVVSLKLFAASVVTALWLWFVMVPLSVEFFGSLWDTVTNVSHLPQEDGRPEVSDTGLLSTAETFTPFLALLKTEQECCL